MALRSGIALSPTNQVADVLHGIQSCDKFPSCIGVNVLSTPGKSHVGGNGDLRSTARALIDAKPRVDVTFRRHTSPHLHARSCMRGTIIYLFIYQ
jgi:hypothetical protein